MKEEQEEEEEEDCYTIKNKCMHLIHSARLQDEMSKEQPVFSLQHIQSVLKMYKKKHSCNILVHNVHLLRCIVSLNDQYFKDKIGII